MEKKSRQIIAFHVGDRSEDSAKALWEKIPQKLKQVAVFYTDQWEAYQKIIPAEQHFYTVFFFTDNVTFYKPFS